MKGIGDLKALLTQLWGLNLKLSVKRRYVSPLCPRIRHLAPQIVSD